MIFEFNPRYTICVYRELSEERELLDDNIGENHRLSRKLGRIERQLDRIDHDKHKVSHCIDFANDSNKKHINVITVYVGILASVAFLCL